MSTSNTASPVFYFRYGLFAGAIAFVLLVCLWVLAGALFWRANAVLNQEQEQRLVSLGRAATPYLSHLLFAEEADTDAANEFLQRKLKEDGLENAFVFNSDNLSLADARPATVSGKRYTMLEIDPALAEEAWKGRNIVSEQYELVGIQLRSAYFPIIYDGVAEPSALLVLETGADFHASLLEVRNFVIATMLLSAAVTFVLGLALNLTIKGREKAVRAAFRAEQLALSGRLAAQVAHEIKNPLAIVAGSVQLLQKRENLSKRGDSLFSELREELSRIDLLVEDFLGLSSEIALDKKDSDLNDLVRRTVSMTAPAAGKEILLELDSNLPAIDFDERRIKQALINLLLNALDALYRNGKVIVRTANKEEGVVLEVEDNGKGMGPQTLERVLEPFYTTKEKGTGLGLVTVQQILEAHKGKLNLQSRPGKGTKVQMVLPHPE